MDAETKSTAVFVLPQKYYTSRTGNNRLYYTSYGQWPYIPKLFDLHKMETVELSYVERVRAIAETMAEEWRGYSRYVYTDKETSIRVVIMSYKPITSDMILHIGLSAVLGMIEKQG